MNGIIRKKVLALFSAVGLVGSAASATAQVLKGSEPAADQKTEGKIKYDKNKQESNAVKGQATIKYNKTATDAGSKDAAKFKKSKSEDAASKDAAAIKGGKTGADAITIKQKSSIKYKKGAAEKGSANQAEWIKAGKNQGGTQGQATPKTTGETPK